MSIWDRSLGGVELVVIRLFYFSELAECVCKTIPENEFDFDKRYSYWRF